MVREGLILGRAWSLVVGYCQGGIEEDASPKDEECMVKVCRKPDDEAEIPVADTSCRVSRSDRSGQASQAVTRLRLGSVGLYLVPR